jgi:hypothetical protein
MAKRNKETQKQEFANSLVRLIDSRFRANVIDGTVVSVDETKFTCVVKVERETGKYIEYNDVILGVLIDSKASFIRIPKVNTFCHITFLEFNTSRPTLLDVHECDKIMFTVGNQTLEIKDGSFIFNGGNKGGMVLLDKLLAAYNCIVTDMQVIKVALATPCSVGVPLNAAFIPKTTQKSKSDFENTSIRQ